MVTFISVLFINNKLFLGLFKEKFHEKINILGTEFSKVAALSLLLHRRDILIKRADDLLKDRDIIGVKVILKNNKTTFTKGITEGYRIIFPIFTKQFSENDFFNLEEKVVKLGRVELYYSRENIKRVMFKVFFISFFISFVIAITVFIFAFKILKKNFLEPLEFWQGNLENQKSLSNYYTKIKQSCPPEIDKLFRAYIDLMKKLEDNYKKLIHQTTLAEVGKFSLTVAHEIKNPLGIIKGAFDIIKKESIDTTTKQEMIQYIGEEINRIDRLIKDFLTMAKNFKLNEKNINLTDFIYSVAKKCQVNYPEINIKIKIYKNIQVLIDEEVFTHIIMNLVKNAVEANATEIKFILSVNKKSWNIVIKDNGKGISDKVKEKIFDPFFTTKKDGSGIGLTFVVKAVYQLNGNISFYSREGKGTTFIISFHKNRIV